MTKSIDNIVDDMTMTRLCLLDEMAPIMNLDTQAQVKQLLKNMQINGDVDLYEMRLSSSHPVRVAQMRRDKKLPSQLNVAERWEDYQMRTKLSKMNGDKKGRGNHFGGNRRDRSNRGNFNKKHGSRGGQNNQNGSEFNTRSKKGQQGRGRGGQNQPRNSRDGKNRRDGKSFSGPRGAKAREENPRLRTTPAVNKSKETAAPNTAPANT